MTMKRDCDVVNSLVVFMLEIALIIVVPYPEADDLTQDLNKSTFPLVRGRFNK
jgi:hypothetical protein